MTDGPKIQKKTENKKYCFVPNIWSNLHLVNFVKDIETSTCKISFESILRPSQSQQNSSNNIKSNFFQRIKAESYVMYLFSIYCVNIGTFSNGKWKHITRYISLSAWNGGIWGRGKGILTWSLLYSTVGKGHTIKEK